MSIKTLHATKMLFTFLEIAVLMYSRATPTSVYLCGNRKSVINANVTSEYTLKVTPKLTANSTMETVTCTITFIFQRDSGFCLVQDTTFADIRDSNVELKILYRVNKTEKLLHRLKYYPDTFMHKHHCELSTNLTFVLQKINIGYPVNLTKINLRFKIIDIRNGNRTIYFHDRYCNDKYLLDRSRVVVVNRPPGKIGELDYLCLITVQKVKKDRKMCFVFGTSTPETGNQKWNFSVSSTLSLSPQYFLYQLNSSEWGLNERYRLWCDQKKTESLHLIFCRKNNSARSETPGNFNFAVLDIKDDAN